MLTPRMPQLAPESKIWRRERAVAHVERSTLTAEPRKVLA
jgi:hypothetical protein